MVSISATKLIKKWPKTKKNDNFLTPNKAQALKFMYPFQFLGQITKSDTLVSLICSFQSDGLFHAVGTAELEQDFLVFPLHQYVGAEVFYGDSVYCYQVIACTDSFLVGR